MDEMGSGQANKGSEPAWVFIFIYMHLQVVIT